MKEEIDPFYQKRAEEFVDMLFDTEFTNPDIKRKDMRALEDYLAYMYQSTAKSAQNAYKFSEKIKHLKQSKGEE